ncbi:hypothetical protein BLNAU_14411 [Blattamonas nauphoetae]|uniref:Uncharacterized protein n=1 Tax=Blattamonas nauphoetae TaxID=2049346 RepID=A0ABQ9XKT0_9EUKA|nr:hypothetical protein BLNAU_14411 [Blattamonas nauphoetae]
MECSGFMLADSGRSGSSRIMIVGSSHKSSSRNVLLPLVGRGLGQLNTKMNEWMTDEEACGGVLVEREEIVGVGLSFDSTHFPLGSGPLFSFAEKSLSSRSEIMMVGETSTELRTTTILNVTSSSGAGRRKILGVESCVWERVVGSRISGSTNHDMGTGLCGRLGGNVVCVNSSFSSCVRTSNAIIDKKHENLTTDDPGRIFVEITLGITSMKFSLCTFNEMTIASGSNNGGSAIFLDQSNSTLSITRCFFHKCIVNGSSMRGGAIYMNESLSDCPVSLSFSSFTECEVNGTSLNNYGGSVFCTSSSTISVSNCFFEESYAHRDGALSLHYSVSTLSNCAFVSCSSNQRAGAIALYDITSKDRSDFDLSYLQFRECSTIDSNSKDLYFDGVSTTIVSKETIKFCDSTSGKSNVYVVIGGSDKSNLVPQLASTPEVIVTVSFSGNTATVTATADPAVKGTMGILLNGSNVPRLVHVQFVKIEP